MLIIPERGDLIVINFYPQAGHEQAGRRNAIVLSPKAFNEKTGFIAVCPITSQKKGYPFEVSLPNEGISLDDNGSPVLELYLQIRLKPWIGKPQLISKLI